MKDLNFFAVIPAPVLNDGDLLPGAKLLFGIVSQLLNEKGYCYATNNLFAERLHISERTVRAWLSDLQRMGHIDIEIDRDRATIQEPQPRIYSRYRGGSTLPAGGGSTLPAYKRKDTKRKNTTQSDCVECVSCFDFTQFWNAYNLKRDRSKCENKYAHITEPDRQRIKDVLPGYVQRTHTDGTFPSRKYPLTWLNGRCWKDDEKSIPQGQVTGFRDLASLSEEELYQ